MSASRVPAPYSMSRVEAKRQYDEHVERGNNALYEVTADREFAKADSLAEHFGFGQWEVKA